MGNGMLLHSGRLVDPLTLSVQDINIRDIAHALSMICRYNGHVRSFYSVAEHSFHVSRIAEDKARNDISFATAGNGTRWGLLHDATEAYLGDCVRPLKVRSEFAFYREVEEALRLRIAERFGLPSQMPAVVVSADAEICGTEMRQLLTLGTSDQSLRFTMPDGCSELPASIPGLVVGLWSPDEAETRFLARYQELWS